MGDALRFLNDSNPFLCLQRLEEPILVGREVSNDPPARNRTDHREKTFDDEDPSPTLDRRVVGSGLDVSEAVSQNSCMESIAKMPTSAHRTIWSSLSPLAAKYLPPKAPLNVLTPKKIPILKLCLLRGYQFVSKKLMDGNKPDSAKPKKNRAACNPAAFVTIPMRVITIPQATMMIGMNRCGFISFKSQLNGTSKATYLSWMGLIRWLVR